MCHSSTRPGTSYHVTQFYQAFPRVSTASDKRWGEKAWERGYWLGSSDAGWRDGSDTGYSDDSDAGYRQLQLSVNSCQRNLSVHMTRYYLTISKLMNSDEAVCDKQAGNVMAV